MGARSTSNWAKVFTLTLDQLKPPDIQRTHAAVARQVLADHLSGLQGARPGITTVVDGRRGASEDSVKPYGVIRYEFSYFREIAAWALEQASALSPVDSGRYKNSWFVLADGERCEPQDIPDGAARVAITNDQPYHRKIHVGAMRGLSVPPMIVERLRAAVRRRYGNFVAGEVRFILLEGGYVLKGRQRTASIKELATWHGVPEPVIKGWLARGDKLGTIDLTKRTATGVDRRSAAFREGRQYLTSRSDTKAGQPMTYPALELTLR